MKTYKGLDVIELRKIALDSCVKGYRQNKPESAKEDWQIELAFMPYVYTLPIMRKNNLKSWSTLAGIYDRYMQGRYIK